MNFGSCGISEWNSKRFFGRAMASVSFMLEIGSV
jgi:hypothetical protein